MINKIFYGIFLSLSMYMLTYTYSFSQDSCSLINKTCIEPAETRKIGGEDVYRDCWRWEKKYKCGEDKVTNYCTALTTASCSIVSDTCISVDDDGRCLNREFIYDCPSKQSGTGINPIVEDENITKDEQDFAQCKAIEISSNCTITSETCIEGEETRIIGGVPIHKSCWNTQRKYSCTDYDPVSNCNTIPSECVFESEECASTLPNGNCDLNVKKFKCTAAGTGPTETETRCGEDVYCINGDCDTVQREPNTEFAQAAAMLNVMSEAGKTMDKDSLRVFAGENLKCSRAILGTVNCCTDSGLLNPLFGCNEEEEQLAKKAEGKLCHYIGTYCSKKILGVCTKTKKSYCCFSGKLPRLAMVEGKAQLGLGWGTPETAQCDGLTIEQFQQVNFKEIDLSEIYPDVTAPVNVRDNNNVLTDLTDKINEYYSDNE